MNALSTSTRNLYESVRWRLRDRTRHYASRVHRARLHDVTFIGITGSSGKTTTKELSAAILSSTGPCHRSVASLNDHEMIDRTVLATSRTDRYCVVEMGATARGYLDRPLRAVRPQIGVLTCIAQEHYATFRTLEAVAAEKRKLIDSLPADGTAVLNRDDPHVRTIGERCSARTVWVGSDEGSTLQLLEASSAWPEPLTLRFRFEGTEYRLVTRLHGRHLATSVLCALGVAVATGVRLQKAVEALGRVDSANGRMQIMPAGGGVVFVRDDFKAPQWSLDAPLDFLRHASATRKVAVIGTISDTPQDPASRYSRAARRALGAADLVLMVGNQALDHSRVERLHAGEALRSFKMLEDAAAFLRTELRAGDLVLLKGTNKQDHLVRLALDRVREVRCWDMSCNREVFCTGCSRLSTTDASPC